jgi:hypothetical protein
LGICYSNGRGVLKDAAQAVEWFRKAAEQGNESAQLNLGICYETGAGPPKDEVEAVKWYRKAAEQGSASAQANLGTCYLNGTGISKDEGEAMKWFQKATEQGFELPREVNNKVKLYNAINTINSSIDKYLELVNDVTPNPTAGPSKKTVVEHMWGFCRACEVQSNDKSFTLQRGNTLRSTGFKGIPIGVELYPIRMSGSQLQMTYYFYQDEFGDWKGVEK